MTAPDPRLDEIEARLAAVPAKGESQFVGLALPVAATTELWNLRQLARADVAYLLAELRAARATNERLNRRAQVAEAALNAVTSEGRAGIREGKLLHEYWQRAEDARAELRKAHAALARVEAACDRVINNEDGHKPPGPPNPSQQQATALRIRAAVAAANGDGDACD